MSLLRDLEQGINHWYNKLMEYKDPLHIGEHKYTLREVGSLIPSSDEPAQVGLVVQKNWEEGIRQIHNEIRRIPEEFRWVYLQDRQVWVSNSTHTEETKVKGDLLLQIALSECTAGKLHSVHTHTPFYSFNTKDQLNRLTVGILGMLEGKQLKRKDKVIRLGEGALPSYGKGQDLHDHWNFLAIAQLYGRTLSVGQHIISYYGRTSYELTEAGRNAKYLSTYEREIKFDLERHVDDTPAQIIEQLEILASRIRANHLLGKPAYTFEFEQMRDVPWRPTGRIYSISPPD